VRSIIFAGPSISAPEVHPLLDADCRPPAAMGDVYVAALEAPAAIGIIDGFFELQPAVWHKEILWAMSQGIHVYGSASMGALRAAELEAFGMVGVGAIFEAFRDGVLEDDDEVAVAHADAEHGYRPVSDAMVNIRATLQKAQREGVIAQADALAAEAFAKSQFYPERSYAHLLEEFPGLAPLRGWLREHAVNQKREDAVAMLRTMAEFLATSPGRLQPTFAMEETLLWEDLRAWEGSRSFRESKHPLLQRLEENPQQAQKLLTAALAWRSAVERARQRGIEPSAVVVAEKAQEFCSRLGIHDEASLADWLQRNQCTRQQLDRILSHAGLVEEVMVHFGEDLQPYVLEYLLWTGAGDWNQGMRIPIPPDEATVSNKSLKP
jgi:hypothetical protein